MDNPIDAVIERAMAEQPELTVMCTFQPDGWIDECGADRVIRMPIAENAILGMAVGMAMTGRRVIADIVRAAFLYSAMDPLVNQATKWRYQSGGQYSLPLLIRAMTRGGENLGGQHEHVPHAAMTQIPGLVVAVPSSPNSAAGLIATALNYPDPVLMLESVHLFMPGWEEQPDHEPSADPIPFGVAHEVRAGQDVTLVGIGNTVATCLRAADELAGRGCDAQVIDLRTAAPLDCRGVAAMATSNVVLVDETPARCSVVSDLGFYLVGTGAVERDRIAAVTAAACPLPASPVLQQAVLPGPERVAAAATRLLDSGRRSSVG